MNGLVQFNTAEVSQPFAVIATGSGCRLGANFFLAGRNFGRHDFEWQMSLLKLFGESAGFSGRQFYRVFSVAKRSS